MEDKGEKKKEDMISKYWNDLDGGEIVIGILAHSADYISRESLYINERTSRVKHIFDLIKLYEGDIDYADKKTVKELHKFYYHEDILYTTQVINDMEDYKHNRYYFCTTTSENNRFRHDFVDKEAIYKIYMKKDSKVLHLQKAIDTIITKQSKNKLWNKGQIREPDEIICLVEDIDRIEKIREL